MYCIGQFKGGSLNTTLGDHLVNKTKCIIQNRTEFYLDIKQK